jgi:hypothetical protein
MDSHPIAGLFKRPNYEEPIASELSEDLLENHEPLPHSNNTMKTMLLMPMLVRHQGCVCYFGRKR